MQAVPRPRTPVLSADRFNAERLAADIGGVRKRDWSDLGVAVACDCELDHRTGAVCVVVIEALGPLTSWYWYCEVRLYSTYPSSPVLDIFFRSRGCYPGLTRHAPVGGGDLCVPSATLVQRIERIVSLAPPSAWPDGSSRLWAPPTAVRVTHDDDAVAPACPCHVCAWWAPAARRRRDPSGAVCRSVQRELKCERGASQRYSVEFCNPSSCCTAEDHEARPSELVHRYDLVVRLPGAQAPRDAGCTDAYFRLAVRQFGEGAGSRGVRIAYRGCVRAAPDVQAAIDAFFERALVHQPLAPGSDSQWTPIYSSESLAALVLHEIDLVLGSVTATRAATVPPREPALQDEREPPGDGSAALSVAAPEDPALPIGAERPGDVRHGVSEVAEHESLHVGDDDHAPISHWELIDWDASSSF